MKKSASLCACFAATLLTLSAVAVSPAAVVPGDTFSFDLASYSVTGDTEFALISSKTAVFGATTTFAGAGPNGQDLTVSSNETFNGLSTTDFFSLSTPANFITTADYFGAPVNGLKFDIGTDQTGGNLVSLVLPIATYTAAETVTYSGGTLSGGDNSTVLSANGKAFSAHPSVDTGSTATAAYFIRTITYSITYTNVVPEPSTYAFLMGGALILGWVVIRRRQSATA